MSFLAGTLIFTWSGVGFPALWYFTFYFICDSASQKWGVQLSVLYLFAVSGEVALSEIAGPFSATDVAANCSAGVLKEPLLWVISYALMAVCAVVLIILLLLLVLPCRNRNRSGEITDESSLVRHRIKWLRGNRQAGRVSRQGDSEQSASTAVEKGVRLSLHPTVTSECLTDSRLHSSAWPMELDTGRSTASWQKIHPKNTCCWLFLIITDDWSYHVICDTEEGIQHRRKRTDTM